MATPIDLLDPPAVMSYGGLVDASTAEGRGEETADWGDAIAAALVADPADATTAAAQSANPSPKHLAHITSRRGAYGPAR
jgi:hypothetical protein